MTLQRLIIAPEQFSAQHIQLTAEQQHYLYRVLRLSTGEQFIALNGNGGHWLVALTDDPARATILEQLAGFRRLQPAVTLATAMPKGNGFDDIVRQTTELGVSELQPIITERTLHRPNPKKLDRWRRIAAEATEQSERLWLPTLRDPLPWAEWLSQAGTGQRYICVTRRSTPHLLTRLQQIHEQDLGNMTITIATGPEGGWTASEIDQAMEIGFWPVSLGTTILRAVTAPMVALAVAMAVANSPSPPDTSE